MTETPFTTEEQTGFWLWCHNCDEFPEELEITTSDHHMVVECGVCGNSEVYR